MYDCINLKPIGAQFGGFMATLMTKHKEIAAGANASGSVTKTTFRLYQDQWARSNIISGGALGRRQEKRANFI